jgi:hypothetical protein
LAVDLQQFKYSMYVQPWLGTENQWIDTIAGLEDLPHLVDGNVIWSLVLRQRQKWIESSAAHEHVPHCRGWACYRKGAPHLNEFET